MGDAIILIPAYQPDQRLVGLVDELLAAGVERIVVVNDGSEGEYEAIFQTIKTRARVDVLEHACNLGKGAALKTGLNHFYCQHPDRVGVVTADADGQHLTEDILGMAAALVKGPATLTIGARRLDPRVPFRSRLGNVATRLLFHFLIGAKLSDTQSGLRAIPRDMIPRLLKLRSAGYEFELDMLIAFRQDGRRIAELPITTVYLDGNRSSHFDPLWDSARVYFVLFRFALVSVAAALIDAAVFFAVVAASGHILWLSQLCSRAIAIAFAYEMVKRTVFHSTEKRFRAAPRYLALVAILGGFAYLMIQYFVNLGLSIAAAKLLAETIALLCTVAAQGSIVFRSSPEEDRRL